MKLDTPTQFQRMISVINNFIFHRDQGQAADSCVCSVFFPDFISVNVQYLKTTSGVSRSLIKNGPPAQRPEAVDNQEAVPIRRQHSAPESTQSTHHDAAVSH
jgi:hypothetical protein